MHTCTQCTHTVLCPAHVHVITAIFFYLIFFQTSNFVCVCIFVSLCMCVTMCVYVSICMFLGVICKKLINPIMPVLGMHPNMNTLFGKAQIMRCKQIYFYLKKASLMTDVSGHQPLCFFKSIQIIVDGLNIKMSILFPASDFDFTNLSFWKAIFCSQSQRTTGRRQCHVQISFKPKPPKPIHRNIEKKHNVYLVFQSIFMSSMLHVSAIDLMTFWLSISRLFKQTATG